MTEDPPLLGARAIRSLLDKHNVRLRKSLGQNFVIDPNTIRKVVKVAGVKPDDHVLEIGAGAGSLTLALAGAAARVTALEIDERLTPILDEVVSGIGNVEVVVGDAMKMDLDGIGAARVVANLPYNLAASVVLRILGEAPSIRDLTVMTQREVGERLAAEPGSDAYGLTSVLLAFHAEARVADRVSRNAFFPVPGVDSVIVKILRRAEPEVDRKTFYRLAKAAFGQRRKTLRQSLARELGSPEQAENLAMAVGIDPTSRPESLSLDGFVALARELGNRKNS
jgi:16S rRNA (adenine1518-N6/adenine1519-N6)-dimethyltransferase